MEDVRFAELIYGAQEIRNLTVTDWYLGYIMPVYYTLHAAIEETRLEQVSIVTYSFYHALHTAIKETRLEQVTKATYRFNHYRMLHKCTWLTMFKFKHCHLSHKYNTHVHTSCSYNTYYCFFP